MNSKPTVTLRFKLSLFSCDRVIEIRGDFVHGGMEAKPSNTFLTIWVQHYPLCNEESEKKIASKTDQNEVSNELRRVTAKCTHQNQTRIRGSSGSSASSIRPSTPFPTSTYLILGPVHSSFISCVNQFLVSSSRPKTPLRQKSSFGLATRVSHPESFGLMSRYWNCRIKSHADIPFLIKK